MSKIPAESGCNQEASTMNEWAPPEPLADDRRTFRRAPYAGAMVLLACSCMYFAWQGPWRALADPGGDKDLRVYYCASRAWLLGQNPYDQKVLQQINLQAGGHTRGVDTSLNFPPCLVPLSLVGGISSWQAARIVWTALSVLLSGVCLWQLSVLMRLPWSSAWTVMFWAIGLALAPFHTDICEGQLSILVTTVVILALRCQVENHPKMAGVMLGLAVAIKPPMALLLPVMLLFRGQWRMLVQTIFTWVILTGLAVGKMNMAGIHWFPNFWENLQAFSQGGRGDVTGPTGYKMIHLDVVLGGLIQDPKMVHVLTAALVGLLGAAALLALRGRRDRRSELLLWGLGGVLCLMSFYNRLYSATLLVLPLAWAMWGLTRPGLRGVSGLMLLLILPFLVPGAVALAQWFPNLTTMTGGRLVLYHQVFLLALLAVTMGCAAEQLRKMATHPQTENGNGHHQEHQEEQ
jgi:hypothetical protein